MYCTDHAGEKNYILLKKSLRLNKDFKSKHILRCFGDNIKVFK